MAAMAGPTGGVGIAAPTSPGLAKAPPAPKPYKPAPVVRGINWGKFVPGGPKSYPPQGEPAGTDNKPPSGMDNKPPAAAGSTPGAYLATPPPTAPPSNSASSTPGTPEPSPLDATYFAQLNQATLGANAKIGTYAADISNSRTNLQSNLDQLAYQQGLATTNAQNAENARGGFAQGALGTQLGQLNRAYLDKGSGATLTQAQQEAAWNAAMTAAQEGLGATDLVLRAQSAARAVTAAATDSSLGQKTGGAGAGGAAGGGAGAPGPNDKPGSTADNKPLDLTDNKPGASIEDDKAAHPVGASGPAVAALARALAAGKVKGAFKPTKNSPQPTASGGAGIG